MPEARRLRVRFPSGMLLLQYAWRLPSPVLRETLWYGPLEGGRWELALPPSPPRDLLELAVKLRGEFASGPPPAGPAAAGDRDPRSLFHRVRLRRCAWPAVLPDRVFLLCRSSEGGLHDLVADRVAGLPGFEVEVEVWRIGDLGPCVGFSLRPPGPGARLPPISEPDLDALQLLPGHRGFYIPLDARHSLARLERKLFDPPEGDWAQFRLWGEGDWLTGTRVSRSTLSEVVRIEETLPGPPADAPPAGAAPEVRVPLVVVPSARRGAEEPLASWILLFEQSGGMPPGGLLDLMDRAYDGDGVAYLRGDPTEAGGVRHWVRIEQADAAAIGSADAVFECPEIFRRMGLMIHLRRGCRFRPDLAGLLRNTPDPLPVVARIQDSLELDGAVSVALGAGELPSEPSVLRFGEGRPLRKAVEAVFDLWAPALVRQAAESAKRRVGEDLAELTAEAGRAAEEAEEHLAAGVADFFAELDRQAREAAGAIEAAGRDLEGIARVRDAAREVFDSALEGWDRLVAEVTRRHAEILARREAWGRERAEEAGAVAEVGRAAEGVAAEILERARRAAADLEALGERLDSVGPECDALRARVEELEGEVGRRVDAERKRVASEEERAEALRPKIGEAAGKLERVTEELAARTEEARAGIVELRARLREKREAERSLKKEEDDLRVRQREVAAVLDRLRQREARIAELEVGIESAKEEEARLEAISGHFEALTSGLEETRGRVADLERAIRELRAGRARLAGEEERLHDVEVRYTAARYEIRRLQREVDVLAEIEERWRALPRLPAGEGELLEARRRGWVSLVESLEGYADLCREAADGNAEMETLVVGLRRIVERARAVERRIREEA